MLPLLPAAKRFEVSVFLGQTLVATAKELHPKLLGGMFFFFAFGATGGIISLVTVGKPILERCVVDNRGDHPVSTSCSLCDHLL